MGGGAALANAIYTGIQPAPEKWVIVPLGIIAGSTLLTLVPTLTQDERLDLLKEKLARITAFEKAALAHFNELESQLLEIAIEAQKVDSTHALYASLTQKQIAGIHSKIAEMDRSAFQISGRLRAALVNWYQETQ